MCIFTFSDILYIRQFERRYSGFMDVKRCGSFCDHLRSVLIRSVLHALKDPGFPAEVPPSRRVFNPIFCQKSSNLRK